jgi:YD repeat-containing protein
MTRYRYSEMGQLLAVMYADGSQHQCVWNRFGQLVEETLPHGGEVRYR